MAYYEMMPAGLPAGLQSGMDSVLNKKFGTSTSYAPGTWPDTVNLMGPLPEKTIVSSPIADFNDGADDVPTKSLVVTIPPTLSGVSSVTETQTGLQIADFENNLNSTSYGCTIEKLSGGGIRFHGTTTQTYLNLTSLFDCEIKSGVSITLSRATARPYRVYVYLKFEDNTTANVIINQNSASVTYTTAKKVVQIRLDASGLTASTEYDETIYVVLQYGSTAHAYEPYTAPTTYTAQLGRTIYGGTADIVNGEGSEIVKKITVSAFTGTWGAVTNGYAYYISDAETTHNTSVVNPSMMTANQLFTYGSVGRNSAPTWQYGGNDGGATVHTFILPSEYDTLTKANNFLASLQTPLEVTLTLATPTDFSFTGQEIPTMLGYNAFWSDSGDTEVTYRADINLALQALSGSRGLMMARPQLEPETEPEETIEETPEEMER